MRPRLPHLFFLPLLGLTGALSGGLACHEPRTRSAISTLPVTDDQLRASPTARDGWLTYGYAWDNQRYVPLSQINRATVKRLRKLWAHEPGTLFRREVPNESTPIVAHDLLLYTDLQNVIFALDARTGEERWRYKPELGPAALCCGPMNRGVAVYADKVYLATLDARVIALDRVSGKVAWDVAAASPAEGYSFTMAPLAVEGKIIVGVSGGEFGIRGFVDAYDAATGKRIWRFWTIPSPEQGGWYGRWSQTTPDGDPLPRDIAREKRDSASFVDAWRKGGAPVYSTPAYDPDLRLLYVATGNPSWANGVIPPGDNLYSSSLVAIDIDRGTLKWYYQLVPHNLWDYDAASPPVLFDVPAGDSTIPAVAHAGKTGWVHVLDGRNGRQLRRSDPFVPLENIFPAPTRAGTRTSPGTKGGANWPPPAYSPRTGSMYVLASHIPMNFMLDTTVSATEDGMLFAFAHFERIPDSPTFGTFSAIDVATGRIRWQRKVPGQLMFGGAAATAGDLVFFGRSQGLLEAVDAETGQLLWEYKVGKGSLGPPVTFQLDGHQRIAVTSREGVTVFGLGEGQ
jgi:alcohol dehydrogenase (cytochrome c)